MRALYDASGSELEEVRQAALVFLYRLLFILYAEDRGLLPVNDRTYESYGLRKPVRDAIAERMLDNDVLYSDTATNYYDHVMTLCRLIDRGDPSIRLPAYDGGLFSSDAAPILEQVRLPDSAVAPLLYDLSHAETPEGPRFVNYRDMSVQQLGSIYERLLEREPVLLEGGVIDVRLNPYARKDSGSFYTPQELVDLVIEKTLEPLVDERRAAFEARAAELKSDRRPKDRRLADLAKLDPAEAVLDLKVLDPAMGSGHFLVTAVDFLSDHVADLVEDPPEVEWLDGAIRLAAGRAHRGGPEEHQAQPGLGTRERPAGPDHRPGHHPTHGPQALHIRRRQEPHDRRAGQGLPLAPQLHRRRSPILPRPPPPLRRLARRYAGRRSGG